MYDSVKNTYRNVGKSSLINIEPNLSSIGDAKIVSRSMHYVFSLFDPFSVDMKEYPFSGAYNIEILRNRFKALLMLKTNNGEHAPRFGMYFDGLHEIYQELPPIDDKENLNKLYQRLLQEEKERVERLRVKTTLW